MRRRTRLASWALLAILLLVASGWPAPIGPFNVSDVSQIFSFVAGADGRRRW